MTLYEYAYGVVTELRLNSLDASVLVGGIKSGHYKTEAEVLAKAKELDRDHIGSCVRRNYTGD